jgi:hypothetical protein
MIRPLTQRLKQRLPPYCARLTIAGLAICDPGVLAGLALTLTTPSKSVPSASKQEILSIYLSPATVTCDDEEVPHAGDGSCAMAAGMTATMHTSAIGAALQNRSMFCSLRACRQPALARQQRG